MYYLIYVSRWKINGPEIIVINDQKTQQMTKTTLDQILFEIYNCSVRAVVSVENNTLRAVVQLSHSNAERQKYCVFSTSCEQQL